MAKDTGARVGPDWGPGNIMYENPYDEVDSKEDQGEGAIYQDPEKVLSVNFTSGDMTTSPNAESGRGIWGDSEPDHPSPINVGFTPFKRGGHDSGMQNGGGRK